MKKLVIAGLVLLIAAGVVFAQQQRFRNGNFTGEGVSYNGATRTTDGSLTAQVTFRGNRITQITVTNATDSPQFLNMVTASMVPAMIQANSSDVDVVSGATATSNGLRAAVAAAMDQARR